MTSGTCGSRLIDTGAHIRHFPRHGLLLTLKVKPEMPTILIFFMTKFSYCTDKCTLCNLQYWFLYSPDEMPLIQKGALRGYLKRSEKG